MDTTLLKSTLVGDVMRREFARITPTTSLAEAAVLIRQQRGLALIVATEDETPAILSEYDIVNVVADHGSVEGRVVSDHLTHVAIAATPDWTLGRALDTMMQGRFRHLIVMENGRTVGLLSMRDIMKQIVSPEDHAEITQTTVEITAVVGADANRALHLHRRSAKQHLVAAQCPCQLDWIEIIIGQLEERTDLDATEVNLLWEQCQPCPRLHSEGGGAD